MEEIKIVPIADSMTVYEKAQRNVQKIIRINEVNQFANSRDIYKNQGVFLHTNVNMQTLN